MPNAATTTRSRVGRPRHTHQVATVPPREEILGVAGRLFVDRGFAATSTRDIAERVGIRQASLYYHFPSGKEGIIAELLERTVRPSVDRVARLEQLSASPDTILYLLVELDIHILLDTPHNTAFLARLPEVVKSDAYLAYDTIREELAAGYERLGRKVEAVHPGAEPSPRSLGHLLLELVETVIVFRKTGTPIDPAGIARSCLRICGASTERITRAAAAAADLRSDFEEL